MSDIAVQDILQRIEVLSAEDRLRVQVHLAEVSEAEWKQEAEDVRRTARNKGIDQVAVDRAVDDVRYSP